MSSKKIGNFKAVTKTLSEDELRNSFIKLKNGEKEFRNIIITSNLDIVVNRIKARFSKTNYTFEELFNIGVIGLIKSVDTFDLSKKIKFSTYADVCIDNEILMFLRRNKKNFYMLSIDSSLNKEDDDFLISDTLEDKTQNFVLEYEKKDQLLQIDNIVEELPRKEREIIKLYFGFYGKVYSQDEIAKIYNFSQSYTSRIIRKTLLKIKVKLIKNKVVEDKSVLKKTKITIV